MTPGVVFLEERTVEAFAKAIAKRLGIDGLLTLVPHEGKNDLDKSFVRKIQAWRYPENARFVVLRDNGGANCRDLKQELIGKLEEACRNRVKIRLVMQELESWYLGDLSAIEAAGFLDPGRAAQLQRVERFRDPENQPNAKQLFTELIDRRSTIETASQIGRHVDLQRNVCPAFQHFVEALRWAAQAG